MGGITRRHPSPDGLPAEAVGQRAIGAVDTTAIDNRVEASNDVFVGHDEGDLEIRVLTARHERDAALPFE